MTVNERLTVAGLLGEWDKAARRRDRAVMIALLEKVDVADAAGIVDAVLADPGRYGF
ncbi:MAG TPA: hypothetical protein PK812_09170 [Beijerinckiaceae bacterium]|nr:hypothetical protein [Beijerinckiaceae bacterium]